MDPPTCMSGVTRFLERSSSTTSSSSSSCSSSSCSSTRRIIYSKDEVTTDFTQFDYLFVGDGFVDVDSSGSGDGNIPHNNSNSTSSNIHTHTPIPIHTHMELPGYVGFTPVYVQYGFSHYDICGLKRLKRLLLSRLGFHSVPSSSMNSGGSSGRGMGGNIIENNNVCSINSNNNNNSIDNNNCSITNTNEFSFISTQYIDIFDFNIPYIPSIEPMIKLVLVPRIVILKNNQIV